MCAGGDDSCSNLYKFTSKPQQYNHYILCSRPANSPKIPSTLLQRIFDEKHLVIFITNDTQSSSVYFARVACSEKTCRKRRLVQVIYSSKSQSSKFTQCKYTHLVISIDLIGLLETLQRLSFGPILVILESVDGLCWFFLCIKFV